MKLTTRKFSFVSKYDGVRIHGICFVPEKPIAIFQMVHGMSEHKERNIPFMRSMAQKGYITVMHDNRGHGESIKNPEDLGYCYPSMERGMISDVHKVTCQMRKEYPDLPLILFGHSLGSLITRSYLRNHDKDIDGMIISGCPFYSNFVPAALHLLNQFKKVKGDTYRSQLLMNMSLDGLSKPFKDEKNQYAWLAERKEVIEEFRSDPRCMFCYTLNGFETVLNLEYITYRGIGYQMENPDMPILFASGMNDSCYYSEKHWKQAIDRMHDLGYTDVREKRYEGMRHEIHMEEDREMVYQDYDIFCREIIDKLSDNMNK